jgi:MraZ protein
MAIPSLRMWGRAEHNLDEKGRVLIPQKFREKLGSECIITTGPDHHIRIYPQAIWNALEEMLMGEDAYEELDSDLAFLQRMFGNSTDGTVDQAARLTLPQYLLKWADLTNGDPVVVIGSNNRLEVWNRSKWDEVCGNFTQKNVQETMKRRKSGAPVQIFNANPAPEASEAE